MLIEKRKKDEKNKLNWLLLTARYKDQMLGNLKPMRALLC